MPITTAYPSGLRVSRDGLSLMIPRRSLIWARTCPVTVPLVMALLSLAMTAPARAQFTPRRAERVERKPETPERVGARPIDERAREQAEECFVYGNCVDHRSSLTGLLDSKHSLDWSVETQLPAPLRQAFPRPSVSLHPRGASRPPMGVLEAQQRLRFLGYRVAADGKWGPSTQLSLTRFQRANSLSPTGRIDYATADKLRSHSGLTYFATPGFQLPSDGKISLPPHLTVPHRAQSALLDDIIHDGKPALRDHVTELDRDFLFPSAGVSRIPVRENPYSILNVQRGKDSTTFSLTTGGKTQRRAVPDGDSTAAQEIAARLSNSQVIVHDGDPLPESLLAALPKDRYVRRSKLSPNGDAEVAAAAALGEKSLTPHVTKFYNSLPQETGDASYRELRRMRLDPSQGEQWQRLHANVVKTASSLGLDVQVPQKQQLIQELAHGADDVVFVVAHNDGQSIYLSGARGESISMREISQISRSDAPNRVIVAIVCEAGGVNGDQATLAELLLKNRLAKTVFASSKPVDARMIPQLLQKLFTPGAKLREVLTHLDFQQHVFVVPPRFWHTTAVEERPI